MEFADPVLPDFPKDAAADIFTAGIRERADTEQAVIRIEQPVTDRTIMNGSTIVILLNKGLAYGGGNSLHGEIGEGSLGGKSIVLHEPNVHPPFSLTNLREIGGDL